MVREVLTGALLLIGAGLMLLSAVGILRLPDVFARMQAAAKPGTLGIACMFLAVMIHFGSVGVIVRSLAVIIFFLITAPVAAHMIGRAAFTLGVPMWEGTIINELRRQGDRPNR